MELLIISIGVMVIIAITGIVVTSTVYHAVYRYKRKEAERDRTEYPARIYSKDE